MERQHYSNQILNLMIKIEAAEIGDDTFEEIYPDIAAHFWKSFDSNDIKQLIVINNQLSGLSKSIEHLKKVRS